MPDPKLQRQAEDEEEEEPLQTKPLADQITPLVQRQAEPTEEEEEEEPVQAKFRDGGMVQRMCPDCDEETAQRQPTHNQEEEEEVQAKSKFGETPTVSPHIESRINSLRGGGQAIDSFTRAFFEPRFGYDFNQVRVHTGAQASETARALNAQAFTVGRDVVFGVGKYAPQTIQGKGLIGHELTHVVQQKGSYLQRAKPHASRGAIQATTSLKPDVDIKAGSAEPASVAAQRKLRKISLNYVYSKSEKTEPNQPAIGNQGQKSTRDVIQRRVVRNKVDSRKCKKCPPRKKCRPISRKYVITSLRNAEKRAIKQAMIAQQFFRCERTSPKNDRFSKAARQFLKDTGKRFRINYYLRLQRRKKELKRFEIRFAKSAKLLKNTDIRYRCIKSSKCKRRKGVAIANSRVGKNEIKICPAFWNIRWEREKGSTLLHESLHILFNLSDRMTGRNSAYLFEELALNIEYLATKNKPPSCP